jgi:flagellar basal body-associated protein FliL
MPLKSVSSAGALHPILFSIIMYVVVLFAAIFICTAIFNSMNGDNSHAAAEKNTPATQELVVATTYR